MQERITAESALWDAAGVGEEEREAWEATVENTRRGMIAKWDEEEE